FAIVFLTFGIYLFTGFANKPLGEIDAFLPPLTDETQTSVASLGMPSLTSGKNAGLKWHDRLNEALLEAKQTGKNVFIDFTGYNCTNCRAMEGTIFRKPEVISLFKDY